LPLSELSRENLRGLVESALQFQIPSWDLFDAACQRFDPNRKGFVKAPRLIHVFQHLHPMAEAMGVLQSEYLTLLILSTACDSLAQTKSDISSTLVHLVAKHATAVSSFGALVKATKNQASDDKQDLEDDDDNAAGAEDTREKDVQLVADILHVLLKPIFAVAPTTLVSNLSWTESAPSKQAGVRISVEVLKDIHAKKNAAARHQVIKLHSAHIDSNVVARPSTIPASSAATLSATGDAHAEARHDVPPALREAVELLQSDLHLKEACVATARCLQIYDSKTHPIMTSLSVLLMSFVKFRYVSALTLGANGHKARSQSITFKFQKALTYFSGATFPVDGENLSPHQVERTTMELLGIAIPYAGPGGLGVQQATTDIMLYDIEEYWGGLTSPHTHVQSDQRSHQGIGVPVAPSAYDQSLLDIQALIQKDINPSGTGGHPVGSDRGAPPPPPTSSSLVDVTNSVIHRQRTDQLAMYLDNLNSKAARKTKLLQSFVQLWQTVKAMPVDAKGKATSSSAQREALTSDITSKTRDLERLFFADLQAPTDTHSQQLVARVKMLRNGVAKRSIPDPDHSLSIALAEIENLECVLLQANNDAMKLSSCILKRIHG
jgi:hypothetical protein